MKRVGLIGACFCAVLLLTGCGGKEKKVECTINQNNLNQVMTANFDKKDKFVSAALKQDVVLTEENLKVMDLAAYREQIEKNWKNQEYASLPYKISDNGKDTITLTIDFAMKDLEKMTGSKMGDSSSEDFKKAFEDKNYTCKVVE